MLLNFKLISPTLGILTLIIVIIGLVGVLYTFIFLLKPKVIITSFSRPSIDCNSGIAKIYLEYSGKENITKEDIDVFIDGRKIPTHLFTLNSYSGYAELIIPLGYGEERDTNELLIVSYGRAFKFPIYHGCGRITSIFIPPEYRNLSLVAYSSPHWIVIDYVNGKYLIYQSTNGDLLAELGPIEGNIPIYFGLYNFTIQSSWSNWNNRPINSPIVIFRNPNLNDVWIFNWTDPHGTFRFKMNPVQDALEDFLIFWEDLFNPFSPPSSVDDWKDHVVRVTILPDSTYRIAVHLAKGGYRHQFFVFTTSPDPLEGRFVYEKPSGATFSNIVNGFYEEVRYWIVRLG